jgi:hypothetical protein
VPASLRRVAAMTRRLPLLALALTFVFGVKPAMAQDALLDRMKLDRLQLVSLGAGMGSIAPSQVVATHVFALGADYGEISPAWRMVFRVTYWESKFKQSVVDAFADTLQKNLTDPNATTVRRTPISIYDATFGLGARRILTPRSDLTPFFSGGLAAHVINAEGPLIKGTFVERALDDIAAGVFAEGGFRARLLKRVFVEASVRGDLLSGFRSTEWMAIGSYFFGEPRKAAVAR